MTIRHCLFMLLCLPGPVLADEAEQPRDAEWLEVEVERGKEMARLTIYIRNGTKKTFSFLTGARGGSGSLDDRKRPGGRGDGWVIGTAPTVLPVLTFQMGEGKRIDLRPPAYGGPTRRSMRPDKREIPPGARVPYASFLVPHRYVSGKFLGGRMKLKDGRELLADPLIEKPAKDK